MANRRYISRDCFFDTWNEELGKYEEDKEEENIKPKVLHHVKCCKNPKHIRYEGYIHCSNCDFVIEDD